MTRNRPLSGYVPLGDLLKRSRLDRPLSDGDVWTTFLPPVTFPVYRNITDHSCLKVYHKDPAQAFSHGSRPTNGDSRMHSDMVHPGRDGPHPLRQPAIGPPPHHPMQGALPPTPQAMPPSPSRIPFGPRQGSLPSSATMPRDRLSSAPVRSISPCPSAILERRDVKPDETIGNKTHSLTRANESLYADPYMLQEGRMSLTTAHGHPSPSLDGPEHSMGLFHRASIRSTGSYSGPSPTDTMDHPSLYRQKSRNSQLPTLGSKTPPPSPHRMAEVRVIDIHGGPHHGIPPHGVPPHGISLHGVLPHGVPPHGVPPHGVPPHGVPIERGSPVRQSFRKEDVTGAKGRGNMGSPVITDIPGPHQGPIPAPNDQQTRERMKAMEQQIASLTGLVQHALCKGPDTSGTKESISERPAKTSSPALSAQSSGGSPVLAPKTTASPPDKVSVPLKVNLLQFRKNVSELRIQLHQMRQLQLQNQEALRVQLKRAEQEIGVKLAEAMQRLEDPVQRQRAMVEEDRHKYLSLEERVLTQLSELEQYVGSLQKNSTVTQRVVTLKDVEDGAVTLRKVGESLAGLKGEFPALQTRMRAVLRVEVEAVKFLKEEPHKLDSMLKRVKGLTDALSGLRKCATEGSQKGPDVANVPVDSTFSAEVPTGSPLVSVTTGSTSASLEHQSSTVKSEVMPSSPVVILKVQSAPVHMQQSQQSAALTIQPSPPLTPSPTHTPSPNPSKDQGRESPQGVSVDPVTHKKTNGNPSSNGNGTVHQVMVIEELQNIPEKNKNRAMSIKAAEKEWEERRQNMGHYDGKEFEKILQEAQANMMKGIPNLDVEENQPILSATPVEQVDTPNTVESPTESNTEKSARKAPEKFPKPAKPTLERSSRVNAEQPPIMRQVSKDNGIKTGSDKANKSPPPPPPRKTFPSPTSGMTTTRSGEVVYTRKESVSTQQEVEEEPPPPAPQLKSPKVPPDTKPKPTTPPPVTASAVTEEEDEGDKIMAELQTSEPSREEKVPDTDENGNTTLRQSQGVIYYVTGQIPKEPPPTPGPEETLEPQESAQPPSQVSNVNVNASSPEQQQQQQQKAQQPRSPTAVTPPPISPKPVGLNGFKLPRKNMKRSVSLKTSAEMEKGNIRNKINNEKKKEKVTQEQTTSKAVITESLTVVNNEKAISAKVVSENRETPNFKVSNEDVSLSPDLPGEEAPPPPDNIAFMITNTKIQALSKGEYQELVNAKRGSVQTVTVGSATNKPNSPGDSAAPQDNGLSKKPVIIIFDEPMDIRSAYKRLSTIFESEEELERMLAEERIDEESEESDSERSGGQQVKDENTDVVAAKKSSSQGNADQNLSSSSTSLNEISDSGGNLESSGDGKDGKKKFKFKFPKKQLAALSQAIRTGTKSGKKTLQVVVYEDEEEFDGTVKRHKEAKRFEITRSKSLAERSLGVSQLKKQNSESLCRTDEIRKNTYKTLDSLEQTIKQLETTISEMGPCSPDEVLITEETMGKGKSLEGGLKRSISLPSSRGSAPKVPTKSALKKPKPQLLPRPVVIPSTITTSSSTTTITPPPPSPNAPSSIQQVSF